MATRPAVKDRLPGKPSVAGIIIIIRRIVGLAGDPVHSGWSIYWASTIAVMAGVGGAAKDVGQTRTQYVNVVPLANRMQDMAICYAVIETTRFIGSMVSGLLLDHFSVHGGVSMLAALGIDGPYRTDFTLTMMILISSLPFLVRIRAVYMRRE